MENVSGTDKREVDAERLLSSMKARQRIYQAAPDTIDVERAACGPLMANVSSALHAGFLAAAELHDRIAPCDGSAEDGEGLSRPQLRISEFSMTRSDYESVVEQLLERVPSAPPKGSTGKNVDGETYTLAVIAFRGRISDYF